MFHCMYTSVNGHLHCSRILAIVNNAAIQIGVQISVRVLAFILGTYSEMELLDHMVYQYYFETCLKETEETKLSSLGNPLKKKKRKGKERKILSVLFLNLA